MRTHVACWSCLATLLLAMALAGCDNSAQEVAEQGAHLTKLSILYGRFTGQHQGQGPRNEQEFKRFIQSLPAEERERLNITDVEAIFVSPRDNKPYVVMYGVRPGPPGIDGAPVVAYEQEGVEGQRYVADSLGGVSVLDEATFRQRVPQAK